VLLSCYESTKDLIYALVSVVGRSRIIRGLSYYDTDTLETLLIEHFGRVPFIDLAAQKGTPKVREEKKWSCFLGIPL
jgi:hypothetical protein